jgi:hypothetical protein
MDMLKAPVLVSSSLMMVSRRRFPSSFGTTCRDRQETEDAQPLMPPTLVLLSMQQAKEEVLTYLYKSVRVICCRTSRYAWNLGSPRFLTWANEGMK